MKNKNNKFYIAILVSLVLSFALSGYLNFVLAKDVKPNDPKLSFQDYLQEINIGDAWQVVTGSKKIVVAVIDTGVDLDHPDLKKNIWQNKKEIPDNKIDDDQNGFVDDVFGWDFVENDNDPNPTLAEGYHRNAINHGTVMSGIIAGKANNYRGIAGISWNSQIMALRVLDHQGVGTTDVVARAIDYAVDNGAHIINLSFVGRGNSQTLKESIENAYKKGVVVVAAAGNEINLGQDLDIEENRSYPVCYKTENGIDPVIGVSSVNSFDRLAGFSNYGSDCIDVSAPGVRLFSTAYYDPENRFFREKHLGGWTGTSVSAPIVSGVAALIKSINPLLPVNVIQEIIKKTARNIDMVNEPEFWGKIGSGMIDAGEAVKEAVKISGNPEKETLVVVGPYAQNNLIRFFDKNHLQKEVSFSSQGQVEENILIADKDKIFIPAVEGEYPYLKIYDKQGRLLDFFLVFGENFRGGFDVEAVDLDGDGVKEIVVGAGPGGGPQIRIFDQKGELLGQFFAFDEDFNGGISLTVADFDNNRSDLEILAVKKTKGDSLVRVYKTSSQLVDQFYAFPESLVGGFEIKSIDQDFDKQREVVVASGRGLKPAVRIINNQKKVTKEFFAFATNFKGGISLTVADYDGDGREEIVTAAKTDGGPHIRIFNALGQYEFQFFAFDDRFRKGVRIFSE
jgi:hypothetical protein